MWQANPLRSQNREESVVNAALVIFLETVGNAHLEKGPNKCHWPLDQIDVGPTFHNRSEGSYTAKVDGVLWSMRDHHVQALMEVKEARRGKNYNAVVKEETCQNGWFLKDNDQQSSSSQWTVSFLLFRAILYLIKDAAAS